MSMPTKGKHHHLLHHHQHHSQQQQSSHHNPPQHQPQLIVNVNQPSVQHSPQAYNTVVTTNTPRFVPNAGSDFHVSGQNYGTQPGGQVGGGGGSVGVPGGRGPPPLGSLQSIGQSAAGIPPGGPAGGQAPPQAPAPGVQSQQPQGPAPTTTPPVHTPSPQEMGKQAHLQPQPQPLTQVYGPTQPRPASQAYYPPNPRPQQPRGISHRGGQGGTGAQVVGMSGVGGGGGQPAAIYHTAGLPVQTGPVYQVPNLHPGAHQQSVYPSQIPLQFTGPPQRHQTHQNQSYYAPFQHSALITPQNMFGYGAPAPTPQTYFWPTGQPTNTQISLTRPGASAVTGGAQHVAGPLAGAQGAPVVPQGTLQQPTQQTQPLPPMGIPLSQTDVYSGHNGGATSATNSTTKSRKPRGQNAIMDIVDPTTGKNISDEIYEDNETIQSGESNSRGTPQPQNNGAEVAYDFATRDTKVVTEKSDSDSSVPTTTPETTASQSVTQSLSNVQMNSNNDTNSQCNTNPPAPTQNVPNAATAPCSQSSLGTASNVTPMDSCAIKTESKPLQIPMKEFQPRSEIKASCNVVIEESSTTSTANTTTTAITTPAPRVVNKDDISTQLSAMTVTETETKSSSSTTPPIVTQTSSIPPTTVTTTNVPEVPKPSVTAPSANPVPAREPFPNLSSKTSSSSSSPPRRKSQTHAHSQPTAVEQTSSSAKEQKEKKVNERVPNSRSAAPAPTAHIQQDHHHQKTNGDATGEKAEPEVVAPRNEVQPQKSTDGKAMQKQKNKNKLKPRELNRKGAEKEGTDMDAFVNTAPATKPEIKQDNKEPTPVKDTNKETNKEVSKDTKEKDNYESKKEETMPVPSKIEKHPTPAPTEVSRESTPIQTAVIEKLAATKEVAVKEASPKIEDSSKTNACNIQVKSVPNDVVDHAKVKEEVDVVEAIVAQKNEENSKISALRVPSEEKPPSVPIIEKKLENECETKPQPEKIPTQLPLKYTYKEDQWSPINKSGKKVYDREFLMKLQNDPSSKIKPPNLPDLEAVLKDNTTTRSMVDLRPFKDTNLNKHHEGLFPGFAKQTLNRPAATSSNKKSFQGRPKPAKPNVIHVSLSLREDVKLRETQNAWRPARLKPTTNSEEDAKTEALYKKVRSVLNKLTPQKFNTLIEQVRALTIDTQERLQGVINLVFEKAVDEPSFSVAYALMCKELAMMGVSGDKNNDDTVSFKKLIIHRCQGEFEKNPVDEVARARKLKEIDECADPEKKKELQLALEEEERRIRVKSVGNIRFIGELYKQGILTTRIMHRCMKHLLDQNHEENLECLCKLLTTVGKDLESKTNEEGLKNLQECFNKMQHIAARRGPGKISSRIRFMLQDVIDLRANKWIPRRDDSNPKTMDQIQKDAENERLDSQMKNNTPLNTPRKDDRNNDRKRNRGVGPMDESGWSQAVGKTRQATYSVETAKLKNKPPPMDDLQLGSRNTYMWKTHSTGSSKTINANKFACLENMSSLDQDKRITSPQLSSSRSTGREYSRDYKSSYDGRSSGNGSHQMSSASSSRESSFLDSLQSQNISMPPPSLKSASQSTSSSNKPPMSEEEFMKALNTTLEEYLKNPSPEAAQVIQEKFENSMSKFVHETVNYSLEKLPVDRELVSRLLTQLITQKILPLQALRTGFGQVLEIVDDLIIDIPKIWSYLAEILLHPVTEEVIPLVELKPLFESLRSQGCVGTFVGELLKKVSREKGPKWTAEKWDQSGLQLSTLINTEREDIEKIIVQYSLEFLRGDYNSAKSSTSDQLTLTQIHDELRRLMQENTFDEICNWIIANVGNQVKDPKFIRVLTTAILETSIEPANDRWRLKTDTFVDLQRLIRRFVDADPSLELQCLYAIQTHWTNLQYAYGVLGAIMKSLFEYNIISNDAFITWKNLANPEGREGHAIATKSLTSFFTEVEEPDDASSVEDLSTSVSQDHC